MAILHKSDTGYLVCHRTFSEEVFGRPYKQVLFDLRTPFYKDAEAVAKAKALEGKPPTRKRKRKETVQPTPALPLEESAVGAFLLQLGHFFSPVATPLDLVHNNRSAREAATTFFSSPGTALFQDADLTVSHLNTTDKPVVEDIAGQLFILPALCEFYKHDVNDLRVLVEHGQTFSLIMMDPPWTNRFIKRKRSRSGRGGSTATCYRTVENEFLASMPVAALCSPGSLVAIWCTNSSAHLDYLLDILLPAWNLSYEATWFWIKVTQSGQLVCPWNGPSGKRPFERLILARRLLSNSSASFKTASEGKMVISIPCAIHSFKPPLQRILEPFVLDRGDGNVALELFARSLSPKTVCWGNQVPLLQHIDLFE